MSITRRTFLQYCSICGAALTLPGCCCRHYHPPCPACPPPSLTPPRGVDPPNIIVPQYPPWPVDPDLGDRIGHIQGIWQTHPRPPRQDGMWPYLLIRAFPGDHGARPTPRRFSSPDVLVAEGFPSPPPRFQTAFLCGQGSPCTVYVRVWNLGPLAAFPVALRVYSTWSDDVLPWATRKYHKFQLIDGMYLNLGDKTQRSCVQLVQLPVPWIPESASTAYSWCLSAVVSTTTDTAGKLPPGITDAANDRHVGATFLNKSWAFYDNGTLSTEVQPNSVQWSIEHGVANPGTISFRLTISSNASGKTKNIEFHDETGTLLWTLTNKDPGTSVINSASTDQIGLNSYLEFAIEGLGPVVFPTPLGGMACLRAGDRVTFTWSEG